MGLRGPLPRPRGPSLGVALRLPKEQRQPPARLSAPLGKSRTSSTAARNPASTFPAFPAEEKAGTAHCALSKAVPSVLGGPQCRGDPRTGVRGPVLASRPTEDAETTAWTCVNSVLPAKWAGGSRQTALILTLHSESPAGPQAWPPRSQPWGARARAPAGSCRSPSCDGSEAQPPRE